MAKRQKKPALRRKSRLRVWLLAALAGAGVFLYLQFGGCSQTGSESGLSTFVSSLLGGGSVRIGIVAGHWKNDSGATCADGLSEVDITLDVAERTAGLLRRAGYKVDLLAEFDPKLEGYSATAFVSIHADSCIKELSGFKVARLPESQVPDAADRLVEALYREYAATTGLEAHTDTITYDMRSYHAFHEISPKTPGAIIEIGFMGSDRELLTRRPDLVARGIARAVIDFVKGEEEAAGTPAGE